MSRTVTLRLSDETYQQFRTLAERENRPLSNFIETAALGDGISIGSQ
jgi:predicted transcriptional regulator